MATSSTLVQQSPATPSQIFQQVQEDDLNSVILSVECISRAMQRSCETILPMFVDSGNVIQQLRSHNTGISKFHAFVTKYQAIFDSSCTSSAECMNTLHRMANYMRSDKPLTKDDIDAFVNLTEAVNKDVVKASNRFQELHGELLKVCMSC
ncbi:hypothetical protein BJ165DRAFT_637753 [Panaeolus papilionaceus]|nr:hypothetical protein BJ165DRAFT_637753 [Panaeolus papilionaceus]